MDPERPGDLNQALMDLGATVCTPTSPACGACPLRDYCVASAEEGAARERLAASLRRAVSGGGSDTAEAPADALSTDDGGACTLCAPDATPLSTTALQAGLPVTRYPRKAARGDKAVRAESDFR